MQIGTAIRSRTSCRQFESRPVPETTVRAIIELARHAPSGSNTQPWQVIAVAGARRDALVEATLQAREREDKQPEYSYYPAPMFEPYLGRRRSCGWGLYQAVGVTRGDRVASARQERRNYLLFDAPVGLFFFVDRGLARGSWVDYGMFLQNFMLAAREADLHTCAQASWLPYQHIVRQQLQVSDSLTLVCGMALGYAQPDAVVNQYQPARLDVDEMGDFIGFDT